MKIVFIHGMNKQQYTATSLRQHWLHLFKTGLQKNLQQQARFTYLKRPVSLFMAIYFLGIIFITS